MTRSNKIKLRTELAGKAMMALIQNRPSIEGLTRDQMAVYAAAYSCGVITKGAVAFADSLMAELGISMEDDK